ncbi:MAG: peptide chain release factor N(5)-glutamine methyltransferase [Cyanobacteria bacterium P01_H01_bin.74]
MTQPTISDAIHRCYKALTTLKIPRGQIDAEITYILDYILRVSPDCRFSKPEQPVDPALWPKLLDCLNKRVTQRMPIQYIVGKAHFYGLVLTVTPDTLIPRPETERLIEIVTQWLRERLNLQRIQNNQLETAANNKKPYRILDLGTGSGAIALAIAHKLKALIAENQVEIYATDCSEKALAVAQKNKEDLQLPVQFLPAGHLFEPVEQQQLPCFDSIVSNPPYIDSSLKSTLSPEVLKHEPVIALFPPEKPEKKDALYFYQEIAKKLKIHLCTDGLLALEIGDTMAEAVQGCFKASGYKNVQCLTDYSQRPRVVTVESL